MPKRTPLAEILNSLEIKYGKQKPPSVTDPWQQILWENVAYLTDDDQRKQAFQHLKKTIGLKPTDILAAADRELAEVTSHGILSTQVMAKLRTCAETALQEPQLTQKQLLKLPIVKAKRVLKQFPGIGDPGAEKILLFARVHLTFPMDSNALRTMVRLGFGEEKPGYDAMYKSVRQAIEGELQLDFDWLIRAYQLLRLHGQTLCKRNNPLCDQCPIFSVCPTGKSK